MKSSENSIGEQFGTRLEALRQQRQAAQAAVDAQALPEFPTQSGNGRTTGWRVSGPPLRDTPPQRLPDAIAAAALDETAATLATADGAAQFELTGIQSGAEAGWWRDLLTATDRGDASLRAMPGVTVVVDTLQGAFALEDIVYELRTGANALRWDDEAYLLSFIRTFHRYPEYILPDRSELAIGAPFLRALGKHAAHIGERRGLVVSGFPTPSPDSRNPVESADLLQISVGKITAQGVRDNLEIVREALSDTTAASARTALAQAQLWQWTQHVTGVLDEGEIVDRAMLERLLEERDSGASTAALLEKIASLP